MTYTDLEIRILDQQDEGYPVELTLSGGCEFPRGYLKPELLPQMSSTSPREGGEQLFEWLFADDRLKTAWAEIRGAHAQRRVRLRIDTNAPELHAVPWELLRDTSPGFSPKNLAAESDTPFSRYLAVPLSKGEPIAERPIKVLVAIANPKGLNEYGLAPIEIETEVEIIVDAFSDLTQDQAKLTFLEEPVTLSRLEEKLKEGYHILHIVAHGMFKKEPVLFLAGSDQQIKRESDEELAAMIGRGRAKPRLVFLASCQSATRDTSDAFRGFAPKLIIAGVPAVLAMQDYIQIGTARAFTRTFYRRLFEHGQVDVGSNEARSALLTGDFPGSSIPVLFSRLLDNQLLTQLPGAVIEHDKSFEPETIYVAAGPFQMGSLPGKDVPEHEIPQHEVNLPAYRVGKYPVTNGQYAEFIRQTGRGVRPEMGWEGQNPPADELDHPVSGVTWYDALAYCNWLSRQTGRNYTLPSEAQWEKAARGTDARNYPWGDEWDPNCCNHRSEKTTPVDTYPEGASPYGCHDMVGNVREWTRTLWGLNPRQPDACFGYPWADDRRDDLAASEYFFRVYRGGAAGDKPEHLRCSARRAYFPYRPGPSGRRHGFRVVLEV